MCQVRHHEYIYKCIHSQSQAVILQVLGVGGGVVGEGGLRDHNLCIPHA